MARPLLSSPKHSLQFPSSISISISSMMSPFFALLGVLSLYSLITFLCGSRSMKRLKAKTVESAKSTQNKFISKLNSSLSNRTMSMVKLLSWKKVEAEEEEGGREREQEQEEAYYSSDQDEQVLWRKNILMGERCRPIDFSGKIIYDSEGKVVYDSERNVNPSFDLSPQRIMISPLRTPLKHPYYDY